MMLKNAASQANPAFEANAGKREILVGGIGIQKHIQSGTSSIQGASIESVTAARETDISNDGSNKQSSNQVMVIHSQVIAPNSKIQGAHDTKIE